MAEGDQALAGLRESGRRITIYNDAASDERTSSRLARIQYLEGEITLDTLIQTERNESQTADAVIVARQDQLPATIHLYRALGGGIATGLVTQAVQPGERLDILSVCTLCHENENRSIVHAPWHPNLLRNCSQKLHDTI